ncbi:MAG: hypothetical protein ACR2Q4_07350 [Geminicoccaceae bacterium]
MPAIKYQSLHLHRSSRRAAVLLAALSVTLGACSQGGSPEARRADELASTKRQVADLREQAERLERQVEALEADGFGPKGPHRPRVRPKPPAATSSTRPDSIEDQELERLEQRVKELEIARAAQEDATRTIIGDTLSTLGSNINEAVAFSGNIEVLAGWNESFSDGSQGTLALNTAQLEFDIQAGDWTRGHLVIELDDGGDSPVQGADGSEVTIDRINLDTAYVTLGDAQRFPPYIELGQLVLPFGTGTGSAVADTLSTGDPLTLELFETREVAIGFGAGFPTPKPPPNLPPIATPTVKPLLVRPLVEAIGRGLGYQPRPSQPALPAMLTPTPDTPTFNAAVYAYDGDTFDGEDSGFDPSKTISATLGYRTKGNCGKAYDQLKSSMVCPWSLQANFDINSSVFDSLFLESEFRNFLGEIGFVPGAAVSIKGAFGPMALVGEWNGAISDATFTDDLNNAIAIRPSAWQLSLGYQFDWHPWVEEIGAEGTFAALGYSESSDLGGVTRLIDGEASRVGAASKRRVLATVGEWVLASLKLAVEVSHDWDYSASEGGTGNSATGAVGTLTYVW